MPKCKGPTCGAEIEFVPSEKSGAPMVVDAKPRKGILLVLPLSGDVNSNLQPGDGISVARVWDVYTDHHGTCPDFAAGWKPGRASTGQR